MTGTHTAAAAAVDRLDVRTNERLLQAFCGQKNFAGESSFPNRVAYMSYPAAQAARARLKKKKKNDERLFFFF